MEEPECQRLFIKILINPPTAWPGMMQAILEVAERLFAAEPDWIVFFREVMGLMVSCGGPSKHQTLHAF